MVELKTEEWQSDEQLCLVVPVDAVRKVHIPKGQNTGIKAEDKTEPCTIMTDEVEEGKGRVEKESNEKLVKETKSQRSSKNGV